MIVRFVPKANVPRRASWWTSRFAVELGPCFCFVDYMAFASTNSWYLAKFILLFILVCSANGCNITPNQNISTAKLNKCQRVLFILHRISKLIHKGTQFYRFLWYLFSLVLIVSVYSKMWHQHASGTKAFCLSFVVIWWICFVLLPSRHAVFSESLLGLLELVLTSTIPITDMS